MCLPVMRAIRERLPDSEIRVMALTTAFNAARAAGEKPLGFRDFTMLPGGKRALAYGERLLALTGIGHTSVTREESLAYLGFNFLEWVERDGEEAAWALWEQEGRNAFLPVSFFRAVLRHLLVDVVITTNSPRSEQAAIEAAVELGIPCLTMVDLFSLQGDPFLRRAVQADCLTVLCEATRENLIAAGTPPPLHPRIHWSQPECEPLLPLLMAADQVVVQITTVGVQAHFAGKRIINIGYSPYVRSTGIDYSLFGMSERADNPAMLTTLLDRGLAGGTPVSRANFAKHGRAAQAIASHVYALARKRNTR